MNAAALIVLILALIGIGVILYYAVICMQIRQPKRRKPLSNSDMGPLLNSEEDYNGNHEEPVRTGEDRPTEVAEASAPKQEEDDEPASKDGDIEIPVKSVSFQNTPECASIKPSSKEGSIVLDIDEEPPVLDNSKSVLQPSHDRVLGPKTTSASLQKSHDETPPLHATPNETRYYAMSDSYEEDGLLVPGSHNKSLQKEPRKRLHAQRSAPPEGYIPQQQFLVQRNTQTPPKHVQFANPRSPMESTLPVIVTNLHEESTHQTVRPKLKSPPSDPGISKESNIFVFGANHEREAYEGKPVKKVKMTDEDISDVSSSNPICIQPTPIVGWVVNSQQNTANVSESKREVVLHIQDNENQRLTVLPLATSEVDPASVGTKAKVFESPDYISCEENVKLKVELDEVSHATDSDSSNNDVTPNLSSKELRLPIEPQESGSESSEPDLTEYSFERGPHTPDPAVCTILQNEMSCYSENKVGLTNYIQIPETVHLPKNNQQPVEETIVIGHPPPTPTSDTKSISPISSNDNSLDEIKAPSPSFIPTNILGTPPQTPPADETSTYITETPTLPSTNESIPTFIVIDTHNSQRRSSTDSISSSLSSSSSSSNGSYKLDTTNNDFKNVQVEDPEKPSTPKVRILKD